MKSVVNLLRRRGWLSCLYLDDLLCYGKNFGECMKNVQESLKLLKQLGFLINYEKCKLTPRSRCQYLGFILDSRQMSIEPTMDKKQELTNMVKRFKTKNHCTIRQFAHLIGSLVAATPGVEYGLAHLKRFEFAKNAALGMNDGNYNKRMSLSSNLIEDLDWWEKTLPNATKKISSNTFAKEIFSDSSLTGWGAYSDEQTAHGSWNVDEKRQHINYLELTAAFFALKCFVSHYTDCEVLLRLDNTTAVAYVNNMGGTHVWGLNEIARNIWEWCADRNLFLYASYIPSKENDKADEGSRVQNVDTEWELNYKCFIRITHKFGQPRIDLFASRHNNKCDVYCARYRDPGTQLVDAFTQNWAKWYFYAFPPFGLITKTLKKIITDKAEGIMVVPGWPAQLWYPLFTSMFKTKPFLLSPSPKLLTCNFRPHPLSKKLSLVAGIVSYKHTKEKDYQVDHQT